MDLKSRDCPLCPPQLPISEADWAWRAWIKGGEAKVSEQSLVELGEPVDEEIVRRHFKDHKPVQGSGKPLSGKRALEKISRISDRNRAIVETLFRVRALSSVELGTLFYLTSNPRTAQTAVDRAIRNLVSDDFIYRVHLDHLQGGGPRPQDARRPLYYLGANSRSYIESRISRRPRRRVEWLREIADLEDWREPYELWRDALPPSLIYPQMSQIPDEPGVRGASIDGWRIRFDAANWFDGRFVRFLIKDPMSQHRRINADGLCAFGLIDPDGRQALIPLLYYRDREVRPAASYLERIHAHAALPRTRELNERFPSIPIGTPIPALVICESPGRIRDLSEASRRLLLPPQTPVLATDRVTAANHGLSGRCWQPLFATSPPPPISLIKALTSGETGRAGIDWESRLKARY